MTRATALYGGRPELLAAQLDELDPAMIYALTPKLYTLALEAGQAARGTAPATLVAPLAECAGIGEQRAVLARIKAGAWA
jgi:hypothetical protein